MNHTALLFLLSFYGPMILVAFIDLGVRIVRDLRKPSYNGTCAKLKG